MKKILLAFVYIIFLLILSCNNQRRNFIPHKKTPPQFVTLEESPYVPVHKNIELDLEEDLTDEEDDNTFVVEAPLSTDTLSPLAGGPLPENQLPPPPVLEPDLLPPLPPPPFLEDAPITNDLALFPPPILYNVRGCGNGIVSFPEQCDDGNKINDDGCNNFCLVPFCGNCVKDIGEECDDCNDIAGDGCNKCFLEYCGNKFVDVAIGEECENDTGEPGMGCSPTCQKEFCGNGIVDPNEQCDGDNTPPGTKCTDLCQIDVVDLCENVCANSELKKNL